MNYINRCLELEDAEKILPILKFCKFWFRPLQTQLRKIFME